jgi:hypothetical protein
MAFVVALFGALLIAPTSGDTGGCGRQASDLDRDVFAAVRKREDCRRCEECGIGTARCMRACDRAAAPDVALPATCRPLLHDGEVCLRKLAAVSCKTFGTYVDDDAPAIPSECAFCREAPEAPVPSLSGAGGGGG